MVDAISQVNWLAVLAATLAHFVLGGIWFVALFGKQYAHALGIADRPPQKPGPLFLIGPLVCSGLTIATTAILMRMLHITRLTDALELGLLVGVGYLGAMTVNIAINPLFRHPIRYALVNVPMFLIGSLLAVTILAALG